MSSVLKRNSSLFRFLIVLIILVTSANSALGQVVISQIYGGGGNVGATYQNDFIEIYNRGTNDQNLNNWSIQYTSKNGSSWTTIALTNTTLSPGQYYLVKLYSNGVNGNILPTEDISNTSLNIAATDGKIALCNTTVPLTTAGFTGSTPTGNSIIDFVGYGTADSYEGTGKAPSPSNTTSITRNSGGCTDTNVNSADFVTGSPTPRNTSNHQIICSSPSTQTSNITFSSVSKSSMIVNWTPGNGSGRVVFMKEGSGAITNPVNGTVYSANANWDLKGTQLGASGYYCIYNGTGSTVSLTNLIAGATYSFQVFDYYGTGNYCNYNVATATYNPNYQTTANFSATNPITFSATTSSSTQINLSATANTNSDEIIVISNLTESFTTPTDGFAAGSIGDSFAGGTIVYKGAASSIANHTNLNANTSYYYKVFSCDGANNYSSGLTANATTAKIEPTNQPTSIRVSTIVTAISIPLTWTAAAAGAQSPDGYLAKLSTGSITDPIDGIDPGAGSATISNGSATFKATTGVTFTNTTAGTMYNIKVYSYTNSGGLIDFNTNSAATFNIATPPNSISSGSITATGATTADINWTSVNGYNNSTQSTLVFVKASNPITTGSPTNAPSAYNANNVFGNGTAYQNDAAATCVYNGDGTNVSVTGLSSNTTYYILIYTVVDETNSTLKNSYSSAFTTNGTTNTLSAPTTQEATSITANGFTANWNQTAGATSYRLDVSTAPAFSVAEPSTLSEGFDGGTTPPANWTFTSIGNTYTTSGNYAAASPSLQLDDTNDKITTSTLSGTATQLSFWIKGQGTDASSALLIEGYNGNSWVTIDNITNSIPTTGSTYTFNSGSTPALPSDIIQFRFTYTKSAGNISFDDVAINYNVMIPSFVPGYDNLNVGNTTNQPVSGLSPNTTYYYRVRAVSSNSTSPYSSTTIANTSNTIVVNSTTNASSLPLCPTCDITVSNGALLTIDESKTYNTITVNPGGKLTNAAGSTLSATTLNLKSNASGTATYLDNGITQINSSNVEQYLTAGRNWYISSPVSTSNTNALSTATSIVHWDETIGNWAAPGEFLQPMRGYISVSTNDSKSITFSGTLNNGEKTIALTRTSGKNKEGFNLVGNPYPSYLNWTSSIATAANALTTIWYRTQANGVYAFHTYNASGGIGIPAEVTGEIPPMQGFWVRVNAGGGTLTTNNSMRSHGSGSAPLKVRSVNNTKNALLRLEVSNGSNNDETVVYFNANASDNPDNYDSPKMANANAAVPEIFTVSGNENVAINGLNTLMTDKELALGFSTGETNQFTIKASQISNFDEATQIILKDKLANTEHDLTDNTPYIFSSGPTSTTNRFSLVFRTAGITTGTNSADSKQNISICKNTSNGLTIFVTGNINPGSSVQIYNALGRLTSHKLLTENKTIIQLPKQPGVYLVSIKNGNKSTNQRLVIE